MKLYFVKDCRIILMFYVIKEIYSDAFISPESKVSYKDQSVFIVVVCCQQFALNDNFCTTGPILIYLQRYAPWVTLYKNN